MPHKPLPTGSKLPRSYLWEMRGYFRQVAGELVLGSLSGIVMNSMVVLAPILLGRAIDTILAWERGAATARQVGYAAGAYVLGTLAMEGPRLGKRWWLLTANARIRANVRADALRGVLDWPMDELHYTPVGDLMARIMGDVEVLGVGVREFIIETWDTLLFSLSLVVAMFVADPPLTLWALAAIPLAVALAEAAGRWVRQRTTAAREVNGALTAAIQEQLTGIRVLRLFGRTETAVERVDRLSGQLQAAHLATVRLREGLRPIYGTLMIAGVLPVIWLGGQRVVAGGMTVGAFVAYSELYLRFVNRGYRIPQMMNTIQAAGAAYARIRPLLAPPLPVAGEPPRASFDPYRIAAVAQPLPAPPVVTPGPAAVALRHVTFRYPRAAQPALVDVSLAVAPGSLVAVTGPVGSGKSALARALLGIYPLAAGQVLLDGVAVEGLPPAVRAARIGYLPQEPFLFSGSVRDSILGPGRPEADPALEAALRQALVRTALNEDVHAWPHGVDTPIGEQGIRISGGQRQRIALARALTAAYPNIPGLLVLDDPFSAVDVDTEARIITALRETFGPQVPPEHRATIILCSHRLAVFPQADWVVLLQQGRIAEQGTHAALEQQGGLYARIYHAQRRVEQAPEVQP